MIYDLEIVTLVLNALILVPDVFETHHVAEKATADDVIVGEMTAETILHCRAKRSQQRFELHKRKFKVIKSVRRGENVFAVTQRKPQTLRAIGFARARIVSSKPDVEHAFLFGAMHNDLDGHLNRQRAGEKFMEPAVIELEQTLTRTRACVQQAPTDQTSDRQIQTRE